MIHLYSKNVPLNKLYFTVILLSRLKIVLGTKKISGEKFPSLKLDRFYGTIGLI